MLRVVRRNYQCRTLASKVIAKKGDSKNSDKKKKAPAKKAPFGGATIPVNDEAALSKEIQEKFVKFMYAKPRLEKVQMSKEELVHSKLVADCFNRNCNARWHRHKMQARRRFIMLHDAIEELPDEEMKKEALSLKAPQKTPLYRNVFTWTPPKVF